VTKYVVCLKTGGATLEILGTQEAHSGDQAIRKQAGETRGRYVAVPVSNWHETDNVVEQPPPRPKLTRVEPQFPGQQELPTPEPVE
jgi:hypothetical protein